METRITEEWLKENRWQKQTFFYQIGHGEDENDMPIWVKNGTAIAYEYTTNRWMRARYEELTYVNGFPENDTIFYTDQL